MIKAMVAIIFKSFPEKKRKSSNSNA